jgi:hypothetical protein
MRIAFLLTRRVPDVPSPVLPVVCRLLKRRFLTAAELAS